MKDTTKRDYAARIARVLDLIAHNLDAPLDVATLADEACFSPFHFHRIYRTYTGETVTQTVRRFRLHRAASDLADGRHPLSRTARRAGYASPEAFSRAFTTAYGVSPTAFRDQPTDPVDRLVTKGDSGMSNARNVRIETHGPVKLAGLAHTGPYIDIGGSFEKTATYAHGMGLFAAKTQMIGLYYDDPGSVPAQALRSFAAITIDDTVKADTIAPLEIRDLPAGRYASTVHEGSYANLHKSWDWLYGVWLPQSGEEPADAPGVEDYLNNPRDVAPPDLRTVLRIKLKD